MSDTAHPSAQPSWGAKLRRLVSGTPEAARLPAIAPMAVTHAAVADEKVSHGRNVERVIRGQDTSDGAGVKLTRVLTDDLQERLDPFLMLDVFRSENPGDYIGGFPDHPHRGFETVTYMLAGRLRHRDSAGNEGLVENGGVQWMTAGRGVIHSEMPEQKDGLMEGFQLWLNLAARDKLCEPDYQDLQCDALPVFETEEGVRARVIAGASHGVAGAISREVTEPLYLDLALPAGARFAQRLAPALNAFIYVYRGTVVIEGESVPRGHLAILANTAQADGVVVQTQGDMPAHVLLIAGRPLNEPIVQHGPFVMNTETEIRTAVDDFRAGRFVQRR